MSVPDDDFDKAIWDHQVAQHKPRPKLTPEQIVARGCTSKQRYSTETMAIMGAKARQYRHPNNPRMWTYPCEFCGGWHLTKRLSGHTCVEI